MIILLIALVTVFEDQTGCTPYLFGGDKMFKLYTTKFPSDCILAWKAQFLLIIDWLLIKVFPLVNVFPGNHIEGEPHEWHAAAQAVAAFGQYLVQQESVPPLQNADAALHQKGKGELVAQYPLNKK
jgi:hypothetical protein